MRERGEKERERGGGRGGRERGERGGERERAREGEGEGEREREGEAEREGKTEREVQHSIYTNSRSTAHAAAMLFLFILIPQTGDLLDHRKGFLLYS